MEVLKSTLIQLNEVCLFAFLRLLLVFTFQMLLQPRELPEQTSMKLIFHSCLVIDGMLIAHFHWDLFFFQRKFLFCCSLKTLAQSSSKLLNEINPFLDCFLGCCKVVFGDQFFPQWAKNLIYQFSVCKHPSSIYY